MFDNSTYPELQSTINSSIKTITTGLTEITNELNALTIPEDYLGQKVKRELKSICSNLSSDQSNIVAASGNIEDLLEKKLKNIETIIIHGKKHRKNLKRSKQTKEIIIRLVESR